MKRSTCCAKKSEKKKMIQALTVSSFRDVSLALTFLPGLVPPLDSIELGLGCQPESVSQPSQPALSKHRKTAEWLARGARS
jgi:hypothetical protein